MEDIFPEKAKEIMNERFGRDTLIALATMDGNIPSVRVVYRSWQRQKPWVVLQRGKQGNRSKNEESVWGMDREWTQQF